MWGAILHFLGVRPLQPDGAYNFWSGFGSDLGELGIAGGLYGVLRKNNCEVHRCWRLGRHVTAAGQHVCRKHHPDGHLSPEGVKAMHHLYLGRRPGKG